ncbi:MAG: hypothetical protein AAGD13_09455 [Pseudomonadota bacterium]
MPGQDLVDAIKANETLQAISRCPAVPVDVSRAIYGVVKDDSTKAEDLEFTGDASKAELWHFDVKSESYLHHFVALIWINDQGKTGFTLFMAYETKYTLGQYMSGKSKKQGMIGFEDFREMSEMKTIMQSLIRQEDAWGKYFNVSDTEKLKSVQFFKYGHVDIAEAIARVEEFRGHYAYYG